MITMTFKTFSSPPKETLYPLTVTLSSPGQPLLHVISTDLPSHIYGTIQCVVFGDWLLPLSMFSRAIHVGAHIKASLFLMLSGTPSCGYTKFRFFTHQVDGHLSCTCVSAIMTNAMNIHVQVFA